MQEAAEEVAAEGEDQARRGSIAHTTDEGDEYYELTDENGDPTGQTTWTDPSVPGARNNLFGLLHSSATAAPLCCLLYLPLATCPLLC